MEQFIAERDNGIGSSIPSAGSVKKHYEKGSQPLPQATDIEQQFEQDKDELSQIANNKGFDLAPPVNILQEEIEQQFAAAEAEQQAAHTELNARGEVLADEVEQEAVAGTAKEHRGLFARASHFLAKVFSFWPKHKR